MRGFPDSESEKISVHDFPRFTRDLESFVLSGKILNSEIVLADHAYLTVPRGTVRKLPLVKIGLDQFAVRIVPEEWGPHVLELVSEEGEILFNRAMYFSETFVLPMSKWWEIPLRGRSVPGVRNWINQQRASRDLPKVFADTDLNEFAQAYAEKMAFENFISHTSPM